MKLCKILFLLFPILSFAQDVKDLPSIAYVYPAGAQRGQTSYIIVGGKNFENVKEFVGTAKSKNIEKIILSGEGVKATLVDSIIPADRSRAVGLINKLQEVLIERGLLDKSDASDKQILKNMDFSGYPDLQKMRFDIIKEQRLYRLMKSTQSALCETLAIEIEIAENAKKGKRFLRIIGKNGVSNTLPFYIDDLPEYAEYSIRDKNFAVIRGASGTIASEVLEQDSSLLNYKEKLLIQNVQPPLVINGQMDLLETDIYRFYAKKGQKFVAKVQARELIAFIADAVPAWFNATVSIKDSTGKEIAYQDDFYQSPDPLLLFDIPENGYYTLEIKDSINRGREDFVYRITLGEFSFIDSIYPLGLNLGQKNDCPLNNFSRESAVEIGLGSSLSSVVKNLGEKHFYKLKVGESKRILVEVFARRLGSPLDSHLEIFDENFKLIATSDDVEDLLDSLNTHHADSKIDFLPKANCTYYILLRDTQGKAGDNYTYKLSVYEPIPDFAVKSSPSVINIVEGKTNAFDLSVIRKDGFSFPIEVKLKDAPKGLYLSGGFIPENCDKISMVLHCDKSLKQGLHEIKLEANAKYQGEVFTRDVVACEDMIQAFYYHHLVPVDAQYLYVLPMDSLVKYNVANFISNKSANSVANRISIPYGKEAKLFIGNYSLPMKNTSFEIEAELRDSSKGISISKVENTSKGSFVTLKSDLEISKKGQSENLIIDIYIRKEKTQDEFLQKSRSGRNSERLKVDTLKAILYEVI